MLKLKINKTLLIALKKYMIVIGIITPIVFSLIIGFFITGKRTDFCQDYTSAKLMAQQQSPYQLIHCWDIHPPYNNEYNPHPPFSILLYYPLLNFDIITAGRLWSTISVFFYFSGILLLLKIVKKFNPIIIALFFFVNLFWLPHHLAVAYQNIIQLIFLLLALAWYFQLKGKDKITGVLLGLATLLRFWPFLAILPFLLTKKKTIVIYSLITFSLGTLLTLLFGFGPYYSEYFNQVANSEDLYVLHINNISLISLIAKMIYTNNVSLESSVFIAKILGVTIFSGTIALLFSKVHKYINQQNILEVSSAICLTLLHFLFPVLWEWALVIYLIPYFMVYKAIPTGTKLPKDIFRILIFSIIMFGPMRYVAYISFPGERYSLDVNYPAFLILHNQLLIIGIIALLIAEFKIITFLIKRRIQIKQDETKN